jgi:hypothetical protein
MREDIKNTRQQFRSSIRRGTGEAYLIVNEYPAVDFSNEIIKVSIKDYSYDGQCEGSRADYLFGLVLLSKKQAKIKAAIFGALATEHKHTWTLVQLFGLAKLFAQGGDMRAKKLIYDVFLACPIPSADWAGAHQILELDGMDGLKFVAEKFGRALEQSEDDWHDGWRIKSFQDENPAINVWHELEQEAISNRFIKIYLDNVKQTEENNTIHKPEIEIYNDAVEEVLLIKRVRSAATKKWSRPDLELIARRFLLEKNQAKRERLLSVFSYNKFPFDSEFILRIAQQKTKQVKKTIQLAIEALEFFESDAIREFALEKIVTDKHPENFVGLLIANYKAGDAEMLTNLAERTSDEYALERLILQYKRIYWENEIPECRYPLEALYNKHTCGLCREDIVAILMDNNVLSEKIKAEIKFDCNSETRELIAVDDK